MAMNNRDIHARSEQLADFFPMAMPQPTEHDSAIASLAERIEKLLDLLEPPSAMIITGKRAVEEYQALISRGA